MWNPLKKKTDDQQTVKLKKSVPGMPDPKDLNMFQKFAMKRLEKTLRRNLFSALLKPFLISLKVDSIHFNSMHSLKSASFTMSK